MPRRIQIDADEVDETTVYYRYYSSYDFGGHPRANARICFGRVERETSKEITTRKLCTFTEIPVPSDVRGAGCPDTFLLDLTDAIAARNAQKNKSLSETKQQKNSTPSPKTYASAATQTETRIILMQALPESDLLRMARTEDVAVYVMFAL